MDEEAPAERRPSTREVVAARVRSKVAALSVVAALEGVQPLNPGYFLLERIRTEARAKDKRVQRTVLRAGNR